MLINNRFGDDAYSHIFIINFIFIPFPGRKRKEPSVECVISLKIQVCFGHTKLKLKRTCSVLGVVVAVRVRHTLGLSSLSLTNIVDASSTIPSHRHIVLINTTKMNALIVLALIVSGQ